jgi:hypothetical protein
MSESSCTHRINYFRAFTWIVELVIIYELLLSTPGEFRVHPNLLLRSDLLLLRPFLPETV